MIAKTLSTRMGKVTVNIPTSLSEVTVAQLIAMQKDPENACQILNPTLSKKTIDNVTSPAELQELQQRIQSLAYQIRYLYNSKDLPDTVTIMGKRVKVIKNLSIEPAGAFMASRDIIAGEINRHIQEYGEDDWQANFNPDLDAVCMVLAHYFYCRVTGNLYKEQEAEEMKGEVLKLPLTVALPIGAHFFLNYPNLFKPKISLWARWRQNWKSARDLHRLRRSRTSTSSTPSPGETC